MDRPPLLRLLLLSAIIAAAARIPVAQAVANSLVGCGGTVTSIAAGTPPPPRLVATPSLPAGKSALQPVADIALPGRTTRFDYLFLDPTTNRLWIAHMGDGVLLAVDTASRAVVATVDRLPSVTGVFVLPDSGAIYASATGDRAVAVIDANSSAVIARLGPIGFPDGLDFDPPTHRLFVSDESGGGELVIDTQSNRVAARIDVGGDAGNTRRDPESGCILVANQSTNQLIAIDPRTVKVVARYALDPRCQGAHGVAIDAPRRLAFVACENDATLLVLDLATMRTTAVFAVGDGPDVLAVDPGLGRLYVASEAGTISIFEERDDGLAGVGRYQAPHAHAIAVDPATHLVYLPLQDMGGRPVLRVMTPAQPTG